jgi:hypothetical protein
VAEKINIEGSFEGTVEFARFDFVGKNETPTIKIVCTDGETGRQAWGDMWCSEKALPNTVRDLRGMGIEGEADYDVVDAFAEAGAVACTFEVEQNGEYFNAKFPRGIGVEVPTGGGGESADDWKAKVFGKAEAAPAKAIDEVEPPF